jgi:VWFA-related protein
MTVPRLVAGTVLAGALVALPSASLDGRSPQSGATPQQPQQPVFRSSTTTIEVDVVVQDARGQFVFGLDADDLQIFENGKPQTIQQFYLVSHDGKAGALPESGIAPQEAQRARRVFVLFFDEGSLSPESLMRVQNGAEAFISTQMGPGDLGGVFVGGALHQNRVTPDRNALLVAVRSARPIIANRQSLLASFREFPRIPGEIDAVRIAAGTAPELAMRYAQQNCREDPIACQYTGGVAAVDNVIERKSRLYVGQARVQTDKTLKELRYVIDGLSKIPGRKTLVLFSDGLFI